MDKTLEKEALIKQYKDQLEEMKALLRSTRKAHKREQLNAADRWSNLKVTAAKRKDDRDALRVENKQLKDRVAELSHELRDKDKLLDQYMADCGSKLILKKVANGKGGLSWERKVVQIICELLVIGVNPSGIPASIATLYEHLYGKPPDDLPSVDYIRKCRTVIQVIVETVAAIRLGRAVKWDQIFVDATTRAQSKFFAVIIGLLSEDLKMEQVTVSSCILLEDGSADTTSRMMFEQV